MASPSTSSPLPPVPAGTQLAIAAQPASASSGVVFGQPVLVQLRDSASNAVAEAGIIVTTEIASGGGALTGTLSVATNGSGVATFATLVIAGTVGDRTLIFSAPGRTNVTSNPIAVTAGAATKVAITTQPSASVVTGVVFVQQPVVQVVDAWNNAVRQAGVVVRASSVDSDYPFLEGAVAATTDDSGAATFTNLMLSGGVGEEELAFKAVGLTATVSGSIHVLPGPPFAIDFFTYPSGLAQNGVGFAQQPTVFVEDYFGDALPDSGVVVTAAISTGGGVLSGGLTAITDRTGTARFTNLAITGTNGARTLCFSAPGLVGGQDLVVVIAGPASQLSIATQPSASAPSGVALAQQPVIQLVDASNNVVSQPGVVVTASITSGNGTLAGTVTATTDLRGVATFANLAIAGAGATTLSFSAPRAVGGNVRPHHNRTNDGPF